MAHQRKQRRGNTGSGRMRSLGLVLAVFAQLCQSLVLLLPQQAMAMPGMSMSEQASLPADAALFPGGYILCADEDAAPASDHDKAPAQQCVDCPLCQAFHISAGFVPPTLPALPLPTVRALGFVQTAPRAPALRPVTGAHQPRAPPLVSSL